MWRARGYTPLLAAAMQDNRVLATALHTDNSVKTFVVAFWCGWETRGDPQWLLNCCKAANRATAQARGLAETTRLHIILVHGLVRKPSPKQLSDQAKLQAQAPALLRLELWHIRQLQYDVFSIMRHIVPPQKRASAADIARDLTARRIARSQLPVVRANDAIVRWLGMSVGDVLQSQRNDGKPYYRIVL